MYAFTPTVTGLPSIKQPVALFPRVLATTSVLPVAEGVGVPIGMRITRSFFSTVTLHMIDSPVLIEVLATAPCRSHILQPSAVPLGQHTAYMREKTAICEIPPGFCPNPPVDFRGYATCYLARVHPLKTGERVYHAR